MLSYSENILKTLTGRTSLRDVSIEQLKHLADTYPYFAAAQFLLSKKMLENKVEGFENALQKTALHFDNTLLLHFNLHEEDISIDVSEPSITSGNIHETIEVETNELNNYDENLPEEPVKEKNKNYLADINSDITDTKNDNSETTLEEIYKQDGEVSEDEVDESANDITSEDEFESNERLSKLLQEQAKAYEKPVEEIILPTENIPSHRIDYFESQGIKLDPEKEPDDKLGTQLKRFTDWLKQMKRINPNLNSIETDAAGEIQAQNMAARSNDPKEVLTETMAEILIKQGKPEEAIHIYEKLSFSDPSKSAYFAAKITELKA